MAENLNTSTEKNAPMPDTNAEFKAVMSKCREVFEKKLGDYGASWRLMRPESVTDQILIKARRIRSLQVKKVSKVGEGIIPEFVGIINYAIVAIIQVRLGAADYKDITPEEALAKYDQVANEAYELMTAKNHDYGEAWRSMRVSSDVDLILMKIQRTKEIEDHQGVTQVSEGVEANYLDMLNYSVFALIKLHYV